MKAWATLLFALLICCFVVATGHSADKCQRLATFLSQLETSARTAPNLSAFEEPRDKLINDYIDLSRDLDQAVQSPITTYVRHVGLCFAPGGPPALKAETCKQCQDAKKDALERCRNLAK